MFEKVKNIVLKTDRYLYEKFGSLKTIKFLQNIKEAQLIFQNLNETGEEGKVRFVGGCVRKSFNGELIDDIDLATSLEPEEVKKRLLGKNIKVIDTGIDHGTVTAIINNKKFEITTLRKDISTDGRHANVKFTLDWKEDAARRDFTINAIYADLEGRIYDPLNGLLDLKSGKIKFIGSTEARIQEDYLRILRFFRFFIQYSKENYDLDTIRSIRKHINGLNKVSNERIFSELEKILSTTNLYNLFSINYSKEIILSIFPQFKYFERLTRINQLPKKIKQKYDKHLILALLLIDETNNYEYFCHKYKTSNKIKNRLKNISINYLNLKDKKFLSEENIKKLIYFSNKDCVKDLLLFSICLNKKMDFYDIEKSLNNLNFIKIPKFPISGDYLKKYGYKDGIILGSKLKLLEEKWIENNFVIDRKIVEKSLGKVSKN